MNTWLAVALGGAVGALLRWQLSGWVQQRAWGAFPWGTLAVNVLGSFLLGFLFVWFLERSTASEAVRMGFTVGFLGALTTFSTFSLETMRLIEEQAWLLACANVLAQVLLGLFGVWLGVRVARLI
ncbi:MAG: fluoride efflux transporter CrcB [Zetaproteobacteria bacterium]|nr:MAG: fluoride efflux transporter CrcB [Zetaproteobacteria bacterium]